MTTINCRFCRGIRETGGSVCLGCGMPVANARDNTSLPAQPKRRCPRCGRGSGHKSLGHSQWSCHGCGCHFEDDVGGVSAVDTRPDVNLEKQDRIRKHQRNQARFG